MSDDPVIVIGLDNLTDVLHDMTEAMPGNTPVVVSTLPLSDSPTKVSIDSGPALTAIALAVWSTGEVTPITLNLTLTRVKVANLDSTWHFVHE